MNVKLGVEFGAIFFFFLPHTPSVKLVFGGGGGGGVVL